MKKQDIKNLKDFALMQESEILSLKKRIAELEKSLAIANEIMNEKEDRINHLKEAIVDAEKNKRWCYQTMDRYGDLLNIPNLGDACGFSKMDVYVLRTLKMVFDLFIRDNTKDL